jgi:hypothetical protein
MSTNKELPVNPKMLLDNTILINLQVNAASVEKNSYFHYWNSQFTKKNYLFHKQKQK